MRRDLLALGLTLCVFIEDNEAFIIIFYQYFLKDKDLFMLMDCMQITIRPTTLKHMEIKKESMAGEMNSVQLIDDVPVTKKNLVQDWSCRLVSPNMRLMMQTRKNRLQILPITYYCIYFVFLNLWLLPLFLSLSVITNEQVVPYEQKKPIFDWWISLAALIQPSAALPVLHDEGNATPAALHEVDES
jgi:hypothetical protein